jgi:hypothetical protein
MTYMLCIFIGITVSRPINIVFNFCPCVIMEVKSNCNLYSSYMFSKVPTQYQPGHWNQFQLWEVHQLQVLVTCSKTWDLQLLHFRCSYRTLWILCVACFTVKQHVWPIFVDCEWILFEMHPSKLQWMVISQAFFLYIYTTRLIKQFVTLVNQCICWQFSFKHHMESPLHYNLRLTLVHNMHFIFFCFRCHIYNWLA